MDVRADDEAPPRGGTAHMARITIVAWATMACTTPSPSITMPMIPPAVMTDAGFNGCGCIGTRCDIRHLGVDLNAPPGTEVLGVDDGVVIGVSGPEQAAGWGDGNHAVFIRHGEGSRAFVALYGHIRSSVGVGDRVQAGSSIGQIGRYQETFDGVTQTYEPHLHFGVHPGADLPSGPTGLLHDPMCETGDTLGWVAPIAFLKARRPGSETGVRTR